MSLALPPDEQPATRHASSTIRMRSAYHARMRIALISDLHGNEVSLRAVLDDVARVGVDRLICLGDVATLWPRPRQVLAMLRALGCDCILGNHDEFLLDPALIHTYTEAPVIVDAVDWCRRQRGDE